MPTLPSTQTQSANGAPLYVPTDGDGNAVVQESVLVQPQAYGTARGVNFLPLPGATQSTGASVGFNGNELILGNNGTGVEVGADGSLSVGRGLVAPTGTAGVVAGYQGFLTIPRAPSTGSVRFNQTAPAYVYAANQAVIVGKADVTSLSNYKLLQVSFSTAVPVESPPSGNWVRVSGSGTINESVITILSNGTQGALGTPLQQGSTLIDFSAVLADAGLIYGTASVNTLTVVCAYPPSGFLTVGFVPQLGTGAQTLGGNMDITITGVL